MSPIIIAAVVTPLAAAVGLGIAFLDDRASAGRPAASSSPAINEHVPDRLVALPTIIANLAEPEGAFVRLEATAIGTKTPADRELLATLLRQDFVAYFKAASLASMQGSSGFQNLRDDLSEVARLRSGGAIVQVAITTFIVQ